MNSDPTDLPPRWQTLSARDRTVPEDVWIASVMPDPDRCNRWQHFLDAPRFVCSTDFAQWSIVVVSLALHESDNELLSLLFRMGSAHQTAAWAVCRSSKQIYRLPVQALPTGYLFADPDLPRQNRSPALGYQFKPFATVSDWKDDAARGFWETRLADRSEFELSQCSRPFSRSNQYGEFASLQDGDRTWDVTQLLDNVVDVEARPLSQRRQLWQRLHRRERQLARRATQWICEQLDPSILNAARGAGLHDGLSAQRLNWLSQVDAGETRNRRLQALVAAPLLLPLLLRSDHDPVTAADPSRRAATFNATIDQGEPLFPLLAQQAGLTERTVRHLRGATLREYHLTAAHELHGAQRKRALLSWLELIPVEHWPKTLRQWRLWVRVTVALSRQTHNILQLLGEDPLRAADRPLPDATMGTMGTIDFQGNGGHALITHAFYRDLAARHWKLTLGARHDVEWDREDGHAIDTLTFEMNDLLKSLRAGGDDRGDGDRDGDADGEDANEDVLPASVRSELRTWSITSWWAASDRWHQFLVDAGVNDRAPVSRYADVGEVLHWLPLLDPLDAANRSDTAEPEALRRIEFLSHSQMLVEEGSAMKHCVSVRVDDCLTERTHIASVTDGNGRRCSTLAIRLDYLAGRWCPVLAEHRTARNRTPDPACVLAVEQLMVTLIQPALQARYRHIEAARVERETAMRARLPDRRNRSASWQRAALRAALPAHLFLQIGGDAD